MRSPRRPSSRPAYVESVASFYDRLYLQPTGTRVVSVCVTLSCQLRGADEVWEHLCDREGVSRHGGTTEDGAITIQEAQCLGYCDHAPCIQVDAEQTIGPMTPESAAPGRRRTARRTGAPRVLEVDGCRSSTASIATAWPVTS